MTVLAGVQERYAGFMHVIERLVRTMGGLSMVMTAQASEVQVAPVEIASQAQVEGHLAVVHVKAEVLVLVTGVLDQKTMVLVESIATQVRVEQPAKGSEEPLHQVR